MVNLPNPDTWLNWLMGAAAGVLTVFIPKLMSLRKQHSRDAADRAMDSALISKSSAEADYFENAIGALTIDRDKWQTTANEAWQLLRQSEKQLARLTALQEGHERQLSEAHKQIDKLWRLVIKFAPKDMKEVLATEFAATQTGDFVDLDVSSWKGRRP